MSLLLTPSLDVGDAQPRHSPGAARQQQDSGVSSGLTVLPTRTTPFHLPRPVLCLFYHLLSPRAGGKEMTCRDLAWYLLAVAGKYIIICSSRDSGFPAH